MKRLSIGVRLTLWYLVIFAGAQIVFGAGMWLILRAHLYDLVDDALEGQMQDLKNFLAAHGKDASIVSLRQQVTEAYASEHSGDYLELSADDGSIIFRSEFLRSHPVTMSSQDRLGDVTFDRRINGHPLRFMAQTLQLNGHSYNVVTGVETEDVLNTLSLFRSYLLMIAPLVFLVAALGGYWLSRRALAPVDTLVSTAREISGSNLSRRLQKLQTGDELQRLSDTLNEMLDRIEAAFRRITEFTTDASHELRTPVSLIRTEAELSLRRARGEDEYKEALRHILLEAERTTILIEQLLSLARADSGQEALNVEPLDLAQLLHGVVESWRRVANIRNLEFSSSIDSELFVTGDGPALRRLADILLDNAFKYTPPPGSVHLALQKEGENAVINVQDTGLGIPPGEHEKIFERFYRVDKARSRAEGGAGLGLAIAQWIVSQHHGSIRVESGATKGSIFRVELPLVAAPVRKPLSV